eukprot:3290290-Lingulodinium_polyedra.AAC.1
MRQQQKRRGRWLRKWAPRALRRWPTRAKRGRRLGTARAWARLAAIRFGLAASSWVAGRLRVWPARQPRRRSQPTRSNSH